MQLHAADRISAVSRIREAKREEAGLVLFIVIGLFMLPINALLPLRMYLYMAILIAELLFLVVDSSIKKGSRIDGALTWLSAGFFCYLLFCWLLNGGNAVERIVQTAIALTTLLVFSRYAWGAANLKWVKMAFVALLAGSAALWLFSGRATNYYASFYGHSNGFAVVLVCACAFVLLSRKNSKTPILDAVVVALSVGLLFVANSRSAAIMLGVVVLFSLVFFATKSVSGVSKWVFILSLGSVLAFTLIYPTLYGTQLGAAIEMASRHYFNKNFFSGREVVWQMILGSLSGHELFGIGLGMTPSAIYDTQFSSHNLYLQTILQSGVVGLSFVVALLWLVFTRLSKRSCWQACVGMALVIGILFHECLEVSLTQNNFDVGILFWMLMGIALSLSRSAVRREEADE